MLHIPRGWDRIIFVVVCSGKIVKNVTKRNVFLMMIVFFQARNIETGALAAVKIIKLEPGKTHLPTVSVYT